MEIKWSEQQKAVIYHRNKNMLVSAAAGSGKTSVLVNRIISLLTDKEAPADLDRFLIVTFTKAAAAEMKERIRSTLEEMIAKDNENEHLRRQSVLIHNAHISTIHSFCSYVIKNYFYSIDIDPSFRIMDEGEGRLLMSECAEEVLFGAIESGDKDVLDFTAGYSSGKNSKNIKELIINVYREISAEPWMDEWIEKAGEAWSIDSEEELKSSFFYSNAYKEASVMLDELKLKADKNLELVSLPNGPKNYAEAVCADMKMITDALDAKSFDEMRIVLDSANFVTLNRKKGDGEDAQLKEQFKSIRDDIKNGFKSVKKKFFQSDTEEILKEIKAGRKHVNAFLRLLKEFSELFASKKRSRNLMDYTDLEHFALKILLERSNDGSVKRTAAAMEIASGLDFVMTDEYQDSNDIQELILSAVSGNEEGISNRFMVGDIKQSIYGFRHARPEIFMKKYEEYGSGSADDNSEVIELHDNFRSSADVIETTNYICRKLMSPEMGGIEYDEDQALHQGRMTDDNAEIGSRRTEMLLIDADDPDIENNKDKSERIETEAVLIANEIKLLRKNMLIPEGTGCRPLKYSDCAILVRTGELAQAVSRTLQKEGVPAYSESKTGYFSAVEVTTVLNYLSILDNPMQDIPFAAVLFSPIGGCSTQELAEIRIFKKEGRLYKAAIEYCEGGTDEVLVKKLSAFFSDLAVFSRKAKFTPIHKLIAEIYEKTGIRAYSAAMPGGAQRAANLDMLLQRASAYEKTSYHGLFNFIRYIEELQKYDQDMGEAGLFSEKADTVRVMTIHKSKGLEFPVVFLSGCSKNFNRRGASETILTHKELGIGIDVVDFEGGKKKNSFYKSMIANAIRAESQSEELRVLYVALTRAREKLYLTAVVPKLEAKINKALDNKNIRKGKPSVQEISDAGSFTDLIFAALSDHKMFENFAHWAGRYDEEFSDCGDFISGSIISVEELIRSETAEERKLEANFGMLPKENEATIYNRDIYELLEEIGSFEYPYGSNEKIPAKVSVSEVKKMHMMTDDEQTGLKFADEGIAVPYIPEFIEGKTEMTGGAYRGTAYHRFWELLDYKKMSYKNGDADSESLKMMLEQYTKRRLMSEEEAQCIDINDFKAFLDSPIGKRMYEAEMRGELHREQPFTAMFPANELNKAWESEDDIVIQGVIDAYFIENGEIVLLDYKTDFVSDGTGDELVKKYSTQLEIYKTVLEKNTNKSVKEKLIYSTHLKKCVTL